MVILPLTHERMTLQRLPWVTMGIIALNLLIFMFTRPAVVRDDARLEEVEQEFEIYAYDHPEELDIDCEGCPGRAGVDALIAKYEDLLSEHVFSRYGYVPANPTFSGLFGSMFLHASFEHLFFNLYFLWLCGCSIEDLWGRPLYAGVYLVGGAGAALTHAAMVPDSLAPLIGASGAIAALMGAFCVRCWDTQIRFFAWWLMIVKTFHAPAWIMLVLWFTNELANAFVFADSSSVAFWAHIGGFVFGACFAVALKLTKIEETVIAPSIERKTNLVAKHPKVAEAIELIDRADYKGAVGALKMAVREDRDDPDICRLLAQCYQALNQTGDVARWLRQELSLHARRRELDLVAETYLELEASAPDVRLTPKELSAAASALVATGNDSDAVRVYQSVLDTASEPALRLRAGMAIADYHQGEGKTTKAIALLKELHPLTEANPEWRALIEDRVKAFRASIPAALQE